MPANPYSSPNAGLHYAKTPYWQEKCLRALVGGEILPAQPQLYLGMLSEATEGGYTEAGDVGTHLWNHYHRWAINWQITSSTFAPTNPASSVVGYTAYNPVTPTGGTPYTVAYAAGIWDAATGGNLLYYQLNPGGPPVSFGAGGLPSNVVISNVEVSEFGIDLQDPYGSYGNKATKSGFGCVAVLKALLGVESYQANPTGITPVIYGGQFLPYSNWSYTNDPTYGCIATNSDDLDWYSYQATVPGPYLALYIGGELPSANYFGWVAQGAAPPSAPYGTSVPWSHLHIPAGALTIAEN